MPTDVKYTKHKCTLYTSPASVFRVYRYLSVLYAKIDNFLGARRFSQENIVKQTRVGVSATST